jgi:hypothetical protein
MSHSLAGGERSWKRAKHKCDTRAQLRHQTIRFRWERPRRRVCHVRAPSPHCSLNVHSTFKVHSRFTQGSLQVHSRFTQCSRPKYVFSWTDAASVNESTYIGRFILLVSSTLQTKPSYSARMYLNAFKASGNLTQLIMLFSNSTSSIHGSATPTIGVGPTYYIKCIE